MNDILLFLFKSILSSGILFAYYRIALRNKRIHEYNRFYLLSVLMISLIVPFIKLDFSFIHPVKPTSINSYFSNNILTDGWLSSNSTTIFFTIYLVCSSLLLLIFFMQVISIRRKIRQQRKTRMNGFYFIETEDEKAPFSFFNSLFWKKVFRL